MKINNMSTSKSWIVVAGLVIAGGCGASAGPSAGDDGHPGAGDHPDAGMPPGGGSGQPDAPMQPGAGPAIAARPTAFHDERGDQVAFTVAGPVHTHAGAVVTLGGSECSTIYKYSYLLGINAPVYGSEDVPNPLAWTFHADGTGIDPLSAQYRVRSASSTVVDWTALTPVAGNDFTVAVHRDGEHGIPALGTTAGRYTIDVRVRDGEHREATTSVCWDHHPLAAPLQIGTPALAITGNAIGQWSLLQNSPISLLMQWVPPVSILESRIVQTTAEAIPVIAQFTQVDGSYTETLVNDWVSPSDAPASLYCGISCTPGQSGCEPDPVSDPSCVVGLAPAATATASSGTVITPWSTATPGGIIDATTRQPLSCPNGVCVIPGRAAGEAPHTYIVQTGVHLVTQIKPWFGSVGEYTIDGLTFTGQDPATTERLTRCASMTRVNTSVGTRSTCRSIRTFTRLTAIDKLTMSWPSTTLTVSVPGDAPDMLVTPPYLPNGIASPAITWDAGDDDLPGSM